VHHHNADVPRVAPVCVLHVPLPPPPPQAYVAHFRNPDGSFYTENKMGVPRDAPTLVRTTDVIEELRPKSPGRR
jgi:hypothetical protein